MSLDFNLEDLTNEAFQTPKAKVSIDPAPLSTETVAVNENMQDLSQLDIVAISAEINGLDAQKAKLFKKFCLGFKPIVLPKGAQKAYAEFTDEQKIVWLYLRWKCLSDLMVLSGHMDLRLLTQSEMERCIDALVSDPTIDNLQFIPSTVIGCHLNAGMIAQLKDVLARDEQFRKLFPDVVARVLG
jgi:hypothetical protein